MRSKNAFISVALAAFVMSSVATTAQAATDFAFENLTGAEYDTAGVYVTGDIRFTGTVDDGSGLDDVLFQLWDDFVVKFESTYSAPVGSTQVFHFETYYPGLVGQSAQGVGLYLYDGGGQALSIDPYDVPHYADPSQCQHDCGPTGGVPEPASWAMMLGGFGMIGAALRGRRPRIRFAG